MFKTYKDWLRIVSRKPMNIFWILFFPIILVTLFKMTMGSVDLISGFSDKIKIEFVKTNIAMIDLQIENAFNSDELKSYCEFNISDEKQASQEKVENEEIDGYFYIERNEDGTYTLFAKTGYSNFANSMIESFSEEFVHTANKVYDTVMKPIAEKTEDIRQAKFTKSGEPKYEQEKVPSMASIYTYPAIIYSILFTGLIAQYSIRSMSSNMSYTGMRVELSTEKKSKTFIGAILATFTVGFIALILLTMYIQFILKIDVGLTSRFGYLIIIYIVGLVVSILLSSMIVMLFPNKSEETQSSILTSILMLMYFLSGGMVGNLSLMIKKYVPFLYYINPAALLSDSINYLSYKDDFSIIWFNLGMVALSGVVYLVISILALRRKKNELY